MELVAERDVSLILCAFGMAFGLSLILTPLAIALAHRMKWVAYPVNNRWHRRPVALMGGVAIFVSSLPVFLFYPSLLTSPLWAGASIMFLMGVLDDRLELSPFIKLLAQLLAALYLILQGYYLTPSLPVWLSLPITLIWIIGMTNAINLLDNMDGLAPGIAFIGLASVGVLVFLYGSPALAAMLLTVTAATIGFLFFNFKPAKIFMGDSGSLFLGYLLAGGIVMLVNSLSIDYTYPTFLFALSLGMVPIFDTTLVTFNRIFRGISPAVGGRDHVSHRLVFLELSEQSAVLCLYGTSLFFSLLVFWGLHVEPVLFYAVFILSFVALLIFGSYLSRQDVYAREES